MIATAQEESVPRHAASNRIRSHTLVAIRWVGVTGQGITLLVVYYGFGFTFPIVPAIAAVTASATVNLFVLVRHWARPHIGERDAALYLGFDMLQLGALLYLTGGLLNPFQILILAPIVVSATVLSAVSTVTLSLLAMGTVTFLAFTYLPLPVPNPIPNPDPVFIFATWIATILAIGFTAGYVYRVAREQRRMQDALAEAQAALAREHQVSAVGAIAAAAAHELGTPLATITVVAKELARDLPPGSEHAEDAALLLSQAERCRDILAELSARPKGDTGESFYKGPISSLIAQVAESRGKDGATVTVVRTTDATTGNPEPRVVTRPEIVHGLGNFISNAKQFARTEVRVAVEWTSEWCKVTIEDDGPGFPPHILGRLGEPYVSTRRESEEHMGLGVFIAQTLLERTGARVTFDNRAETGAEVEVTWPRNRLEQESTT
jgi:two-component system sensor histidine kinase RegB